MCILTFAPAYTSNSSDNVQFLLLHDGLEFETDHELLFPEQVSTGQ